MTGPRLVVLTRDGPEHRYVANRICSELPGVVAVVVDDAPPAPAVRRLLRHGPRKAASRAVLQLYWRFTRARASRSRALREILGPEAGRRFVAEDLVTRVPGINSDQAVRAVADARPDAILVYGTGIVGERMLGLAKDVAFNMHTGISPDYRGADCAFWPIVNGHRHLVGATVHECTAAVDGGSIFAVAEAALSPDDDLSAIFARAVETGTDLYADVIRRYLAGELSGVPQDLSRGTEYRSHMRTVRAELRARRNLRRLTA